MTRDFEGVDLLCLIIDMEGFFVPKGFQARELGYYTWMGDKGSYFFDVVTPYRKLTYKDKQVVHHVMNAIMGLPYRPADCERPVHHQRDLPGVVRRLYDEFRTEFRTHVGFKGGHVEKDLLLSLNIPYIDLEQWGCPKFDKLPRPLGVGCGCHANAETHHCPQLECEAFWTWTRALFSWRPSCT